MDLQPRTRVGILLATAAFGVVQVATNLLPFPAAAALLIVGPFIAFAMRRERFAAFARAAFEELPDAGSHARRVAAPLAGFVLLAAAIVFLEWRQPFYFTEDDNFAMGPVTIAAARGFLDGEWPSLNPYQFMGQPTSVQSMYGLTYPVTYLSFAIVHWLGRDGAYVELFVLLHFAAGYWAMYWAARTLKVRPWLAAAATVTFLLSGSALMLSRNYATMAPLIVWTPLLVVAAERVAPRLRWAVLTAIAIGVFCHSGNGQMWFYAVLLFGVALLLRLSRRTLPWTVVAALFALSIALLLIVPQMWFMRGVSEKPPSSTGIGWAWLAMILPTPITEFAHPQRYPISFELMTPYYFAGGVLSVCVLAVLLLAATAALHARRPAAALALARQNVPLVCAAVALWLAFGRESALWNVLAQLPVTGRFSGPWKAIVYVHLFTALAGAVLIERLLTRYGARRGVVAALLAAMLVLTGYGVYTTRGAFNDFGDVPYPPLSPDVAALVKSGPPTTAGRVMVATLLGRERGFVDTLSRDFASYYRVSHVLGYDRFVVATAENLRLHRRWRARYVEGARALGVRWLVLHRSALAWQRWSDPFVWSGDADPFEAGLVNDVSPYGVVRLRREHFIVWELPDPDPLAFVAADRRALPVSLSQSRVAVDVRSVRDATTIVNFLSRRGTAMYLDGKPVPHQEDEWGRIVVRVPAGARELQMRYAPPWGTAAVASLAALIAGIVAALIARRL